MQSNHLLSLHNFYFYEFLEILVSDNQVLFQFGNTKLISRLIDGNFPDYKQIIPKSHQTTVILNQKELSLAVRRVAIFAKENNQHMKLEFLDTGTLAVFTDSTQIGEDRTEIPVKIEGNSNIIALNAGAAIYVSGLSDTLQAGIDKAITILNKGSAHQKLDDFVRESTGC